METIRPSVFVDGNAAGIERVKKGGYAYLMESTTIEYETQRNCDLQQIGGLLDQKGYGIATPPESPYRSFLNDAILSLQESGRLDELKKRWWKDRIIAQGIICDDDSKPPGMELDIGNVGGVFVVLMVGLVTGLAIGMIEFVWKTKKVARHERDHAAVMMWRELVRICSGGGGHRITESTSSSTHYSKRSMSVPVAPAGSSSLHASSSNIMRSSETASRHNQINEVNVRLAVSNSPSPVLREKGSSSSHVYFLPPEPVTDLTHSPQAFFTANGLSHHHLNHFACQQLANGGYFLTSSSSGVVTDADGDDEDDVPLKHVAGSFFLSPAAPAADPTAFLLSPMHATFASAVTQETAFVLPSCPEELGMQPATVLLPESSDAPAVIECADPEFLLSSHSSHPHPVTLYRETSC